MAFTLVGPEAIAEGNFLQDLPLVPHKWTKRQGLPDDSVTSVLQTHDGYLWVGTPAGLARFDGVRFTLITPEHWKSNAPVSVTALCEDASGKLWIGTQGNGVLCYADGMVIPFSEHTGLQSATINSIADAGDAIWIGSPSGLFRLVGRELTRFTTKDGLPNDFVSNVHLARSGTLWITTRGGMCQFKNGKLEAVAFQTDSPGRNPESLGVYQDRQGRLWAFGDTYLVNLADGKHLNHFGSGDVASTRILSLCEGRDGELWIGTSGKALYCFADEKFLTPSVEGGELNCDVRAICEDRQGNLWLGTYSDGLVRLQPRNVRVLDASSGLPSRPGACLACNSEGRVWASFDHSGLYSGTASGFAEVAVPAGPRNLVSSVCVAANSNVWLGTAGAGLYCLAGQRRLHLTTADGLADNNILSLAIDTDGAVWVGTAAGLDRITNGVVTAFGANEGSSAESVSAIIAARDGGAWLGLSDGTVLREDRGRLRSVLKASAVSGKAIRALCEDARKRVWIGTANGRLGCLTDDRFVSWDLPNGKSIVGIVVTDEGDLWINTEESIYSLAHKPLDAWLSGGEPLRPRVAFQAETGSSPGPDYGWPRALKLPDGKLWFAMENGMVTIDLAGRPTDSSPPPVVIEDVLVNGNRLSTASLKETAGLARKLDPPIRFPSDLRKLEIRFTGLDLSAPEMLRFRYRLEGVDPDWVVDNEGRREVTYNTLKYGAYTFRVQAGDAGQTWFENGESFRFLVPTPMWRTPWALTLYGLAGFLLAGGIARLVSVRRFRRRLAVLSAQQAMERERMRIARDMHDEIGSKLTKISFLSERAKRDVPAQDPVARKLESIAGTSRDLLQTLDEIVWAVNPHNDTLEHLVAYLGQYATEYLQNTAVECELHIPRGLPHYPLSAEARHNLFLAFEESLNNALKHGRATCVRVRMDLAASQFEMTIADNGRGFDLAAPADGPDKNGASSGHGRNGLRNMRQRLDLLGGRCDIQSRPGHGTTVTFIVPLVPQSIARVNGTK